MKKNFFVVLFCALILFGQEAAVASISQFVGNWKNTDANTSGVTRLEINANGAQMTLHAWGKCHPQDCDWGEVQATPFAPNVSSDIVQTANALSATFNTSFSQTVVIVRPSGNNLRAEFFTHFTDQSKRSDYNMVYTFARAQNQQPPMNEDCISFNSATTTVQEVNGSWKVVDGNHWMFDFGNKKDEAEKTLNIIKHYQMNQSCFVGRPNPSFQYMLVSGQAPSGNMQGEDCVGFNPNSIEVKQINGRWKIVDGNHWIFDFENKKDEAMHAFNIIKKYGFTQSCFVGRPNPSFQYLRK